MQNFIVKSIVKTEIIDIVSANSIEEAKEIVLRGGDSGPLYYGNDTTEVVSIQMVESFGDFVKILHPKAKDTSIAKLIHENLLT